MWALREAPSEGTCGGSVNSARKPNELAERANRTAEVPCAVSVLEYPSRDETANTERGCQVSVFRRRSRESIPLRTFLFLNRTAVNDFLGQIEGGLLQGHVDTRRKRTLGLSLLLGRGEAGAGGEARGSTETGESRAITDAARFERLYRSMKGARIIQDARDFVRSDWLDLTSDSWIQVPARIRRPTPLLLLDKLGAADEYERLGKALGRSDATFDDGTKAQIKGLQDAAAKLEEEPLPLVAVAIAGDHFTLVCRLERSCLRAAPSAFTGDAILLGKVIARVKSGAKEEVCSIAPKMTKLLSEMNREERRRRSVKEPPPEAVEYVHGPAAVLHTLAIWR